MAETASPTISAEVGGTRISVIERGSERLRTILQMIGEAKSSIRLLFYIFNGDDSGTQVRDALVEAASRGVKVRLLIDGFGCADADPAFFRPLEQAGGDHCTFHPSYGRRYLVRNHQKLAIFDETRALIGGANIDDTYLNDDGPKDWRDLWFLLDGEAVRPAAAYFDSIFQWTTRKNASFRQLRRLAVEHSDGKDDALQWKFTSPLSRRNPWAMSIIRDIAKAKRLDIIAAYFSPPRSMIRRMARLATRRAKVRVITAAKSDNYATIAAARHTYKRLLRRGVEVFEYQSARLHTKLVIADDVVHAGSANFDFRSFYINLEVILRIRDKGFAEKMRGYFERELGDSRQITAELHQERSTPWRRIKWTVSHWLVTSMDYSVSRRLNFKAE